MTGDVGAGPFRILTEPAPDKEIGVPGGRDVGGIGPFRILERDELEAGG